MRSLPAHAKSHQLHGECLTGTTGAKNRHIRILVNAAIEDIHDDETVVMLIHAQQDAVFIGHLIAGEGIAAGHGRCQHIPLTTLKQFPFQLT